MENYDEQRTLRRVHLVQSVRGAGGRGRHRLYRHVASIQLIRGASMYGRRLSVREIAVRALDALDAGNSDDIEDCSHMAREATRGLLDRRIVDAVTRADDALLWNCSARAQHARTLLNELI